MEQRTLKTRLHRTRSVRLRPPFTNSDDDEVVPLRHGEGPSLIRFIVVIVVMVCSPQRDKRSTDIHVNQSVLLRVVDMVFPVSMDHPLPLTPRHVGDWVIVVNLKISTDQFIVGNGETNMLFDDDVYSTAR